MITPHHTAQPQPECARRPNHSVEHGHPILQASCFLTTTYCLLCFSLYHIVFRYAAFQGAGVFTVFPADVLLFPLPFGGACSPLRPTCCLLPFPPATFCSALPIRFILCLPLFRASNFSSTAGKTKRPLAVSPAVLMSSLGSFRRFGNVRLGFVLHRHKTVAALIFALINAIDIFGLGEHVVRFAFPFSSLPPPIDRSVAGSGGGGNSPRQEQV